MEFKVLKEEKSPFYDRKEIVAEVVDKGATPQRKAITAELAKKYGCPEDCVSITKMLQEFGSEKTAVSARVYSSSEARKKSEPAWRESRGTKKAKATAAKA